MPIATPADTALAEHARTPSGLPAAILLLVLGVPFGAAGVNIALERLGEGLGLLAFSMALPFSQLDRLEGKITTFQNSGNQYHAYRLSFRGQAAVEMETSSHQGVNGDTGRLLQKVSGVSLQPWA